MINMNSHAPIKLSVVISCYKQEDYIAACLKSVLAQEVDFEYEIIIADDCSPDNTRAIIMQFYEKNSGKIKLLFQEKNVGAARNYIDLHNRAQGEYVAHFDGDDIMLPGKLQMQVDVMDADSRCNVVFHRARYFNDDRSYLSETGIWFQYGEVIAISPEQLARWGTIAVHSSYMYRRSTRKTREYTKDFMEWFFAFESILDDGTAAFINKVLVEYRCNAISDSYLATSAGRKKAYLILIRHVVSYFDAMPRYRADLYAHQLVNVMMYAKSFKWIEMDMFLFLLRNIFYFRVFKLTDAIHVRKMIGPERKIR